MMRHLFTFITLAFLSLPSAHAQLPPGSTAPNWTETDINGVTHTLYDYLDAEQVVFLDFSATWCGPCWNYHNTHAFENVFNAHGSDVMAFMIEGDANTNVACLYGPSGCNNTTLGNWTAGVSYPIIDAANLTGPYAIGYYPTIYGVCPDHKIYEVGQVGENALWDFAKDCSAPTLELLSQTSIDCFGQNNGSIEINAIGGMSPFTFQWSNGASTQNLSNVPSGFYTVTVTGRLGGTKTLGPIFVDGPTATLESDLASIAPEGCGFGGTAEVSTGGGTPGYTYLWSNGSTLPVAFNLSAGTYSVTTTDANGCTHELGNIVIDPPAVPTAAASTPYSIDCNTTSFFLSGAGSSIGQDISYLWATADGHIVSGENTLYNCRIDAPGTYELFVTNNLSNCIESASVTVIGNTIPPNATATATNELDCVTTTTTLSGIGSSVGGDIDYLWTTTNGNIVSGATTLTPVVDDTGDYILTVTDNGNGCTAEAAVLLESNTTPPNAQAAGGELTCVATMVELQGNSTTPGVSYAWTGPAGFSSNQQNPEVTNIGTYTLTVTDSSNGCTETATTSVAQNTTPPNAEANGGTITCATSSVTLSGTSSTGGATYSWTGPNGFTSNEQNPTVEEIGTYTLAVTGPNGCTSSDPATVNQNTTAPTAEAGASAALNCSSTSVVLNGSASSNGSQYSYEWTTTNGNIVSGGNTLTPTVDAAGDYSLIVTNNNNGCDSNDTTQVTQSPVVEADISSQTNVDCFGAANGAATVAPSGGNGTYTYAWSNGSTDQTATNLSAGTYSVVVTDGENCTATENVTIGQPSELIVTAVATAQTAPGVDDGTATATPSGGSGTYTYAWSNGETTATITGLAPGTYVVTATDSNGCEDSQTVTVNNFGCAVTANTIGEDVSCNGNADGMASIDLANSANPISYEWSNGETTATIENLAPGTYVVTATDGNNCEIVSSIEIEEPAVLNANTTSTAVTAAGANDGTATANPTGGNGPFTYAWSNGETTATITGLASANYTVIVTDVNGCTSQQTVPVAPYACLIQATVTSSNISCFGENNGQATVTLSNGLSPFTYEWSNGETTATISGLTPGTYTVEVVDAVNCPTTTEVTIAEPTALEAQLMATSNADCGQANGSASVEGAGGTGSYSYEWSNGETTAAVTGLAGGTYTVSVTDANDCVATTEVQITVDDTEAPMVVTQNISVNIGNNGTATLMPEQVDNGSTDNCNIASMTLDVSSFDCSQLGAQDVTLTVVDEAGNSSSAAAVVTVTDQTAPEIAVQNITIQLDENGQASITPAMIDNGSTDNCGIEDWSIDIDQFSCDQTGNNAVVLTVTDAAGNASSGTSIVTVEDTMAPEVDCPENMVLPYCNPVGNYEASATDNCSTNLVYQWPSDYPSGSTFPTGETPLEIIVTDESDNTTTCSFSVRVPEAMSVEGNVQDVLCFGENNGSVTAVVEGGAMGYSYEWNTGATTATITDLPPGNYNVVVTDEAGCSETQSFVVGEPTALNATVESLTNETLNNQDGAIDITPAGGVEPYTFNWTDGNGNFISSEEDLSGISAGNYNLEVTDANGCISVQAFTVQSVVSVLDFEMASKINIYPNPTTGIVTMELEDIHAKYANIHVFDVTGKMALSQEQVDITSGAYQFDISESATGVYIVRILIENSVVTKRLMVSR
ncbi:MAG: T9SS type A sorting domain-containing protein [Saprospiraceae bacterium]